MLHIVFYARIGSEKKQFDIADIINALNEKLIYRHPHVFGEVHVKDQEDVKKNWEELKMQEGRTVLGGVPGSLPAMIKSNRIQEKVKAVGFDWEEKQQIWDKVSEEISELEEEVKALRNNRILRWFLAGAAVLLVGMIIGFMSRRPKRRPTLL